MNPNECVKCNDFPCMDIKKECHRIPNLDINPDKIRVFMISESPPIDPNDYFYARGDPLYMQTTAQAFKDAGFDVKEVKDVIDLGVYITTAIKCGKIDYLITSKTVKNCSSLLEKEMDLFPSIETIMLMGDTAIKALNYIAKRNTGEKIVPSASTYKIRRNQYFYDGMKVFPTYLQTGKSYLIEKSKRKMIAKDIETALKH